MSEPNPCPEYIPRKRLFCNSLLTVQKSKQFNKPEYKMTKAELVKWANSNRYR